MDDAREPGHLNPSQRLHLLTSCQYADKLLSEIEATLVASQSKSPFPKFKPDISPAQAKVVQDYISRMRAQLVRILDSQGVPIPAPHIGSVHSIRVTLGFVDIAFDECRPKRMAGYGAAGGRRRGRDLPGSSMKCRASFPGWIRTWRKASPPTWRSGCSAWRKRAATSRWSKRSNGPSTNTAWSSFGPALATIIDRLETSSVRDRCFRQGQFREIVAAEPHCRAGSAAGGGKPDHGGADAPGLRPRAARHRLVRRPEAGAFRHRAAGGVRHRAAQSREHPARNANCRGVAGAAASGRRGLCGHAGAWVAGHFRRRGNQGLSSAVRFGRRADRCRLHSDRRTIWRRFRRSTMPASPPPCC